MVLGALILFLAGLLLLLAPANAQDQSRRDVQSSPAAPHGWIMGAQSHEPVSLPGG